MLKVPLSPRPHHHLGLLVFWIYPFPLLACILSSNVSSNSIKQIKIISAVTPDSQNALLCLCSLEATRSLPSVLSSSSSPLLSLDLHLDHLTHFPTTLSSSIPLPSHRVLTVSHSDFPKTAGTLSSKGNLYKSLPLPTD